MRRNREQAGWPAPRAGQLADACLLSSSASGYSFHAYLSGRWEEIPAARPHHDPCAAATHHALQTARAVAGLYPLTELPAAQAHINSRLGTGADLDGVPVRLLWARVQLTAAEQDRAAVVALQRRLHEEALMQQAQTWRRQQAEELHHTLSTRPSMALAYWLIHHPQASGESITTLERMVREIIAYAPDNAWVRTAHLLQDFVEDLNKEQRANLVESLAQIFIRYDRPGMAKHLRDIALMINGHESAGPPD